MKIVLDTNIVSWLPRSETAKEHSKIKLKKVGKKAYQILKNHQIKTKKTV